MNRIISIILTVCLVFGLSSTILAEASWYSVAEPSGTDAWKVTIGAGDKGATVSGRNLTFTGWATNGTLALTYASVNSLALTSSYKYEADLKTDGAVNGWGSGLLFNYTHSGTTGIGYRLQFNANSNTVVLKNQNNNAQPWENTLPVLATSASTYNMSGAFHHVVVTVTKDGTDQYITVTATPLAGGNTVTLFDNIKDNTYPIGGTVGAFNMACPAMVNNAKVSYFGEPVVTPSPSPTPVPGAPVPTTFESNYGGLPTAPTTWTVNGFGWYNWGAVYATGSTTASAIYDGGIWAGALDYTVKQINVFGGTQKGRLLFYYNDANNYYALNIESGATTVEKVVNGTKTVLGTGATLMNVECALRVVRATDGTITVYQGTKGTVPTTVFLTSTVADTASPTGKIGFDLISGGCLIGMNVKVVGSVLSGVTPTAAPTATPSPTPVPNPGLTATAQTNDTTKVRALGRTYIESGNIRLRHSLTGIEFNVTNATEVALSFKNLDSSTGQYIGVAIDDAKTYTRMKVYNNTVPSIATFATAGNHKVRVVKLNEAMLGRIDIAQVKVYGTATLTPTISASAPRTRKIEVIGDSQTAGYGVLGGSGGVNIEYEDASLTYSGLTAADLNADINVVAATGKGLFNGVSDQTDIPSIYPYAAYAGWERSAATLWDFSKFVPDVVVVNLGKNDEAYAGAQIIAAYQAFATQIRTAYADKTIPIILTVGPMKTTTIQANLKTAVDNIRVTDKNVHYLELPMLNCTGGSGHPSPSEHRQCADLLVAKINEVAPLAAGIPAQAGTTLTVPYEISKTTDATITFGALYNQDGLLVGISKQTLSFAGTAPATGNYTFDTTGLTAGNYTFKQFLLSNGTVLKPLINNRTKPIVIK